MRWTLAPAVLASMVGCAGGPSAEGQADPKAVIARLMAKQLAFEAYPQWAMRAASAGRCPTLADLREYLSREPTDPWGRPFRLRCDHLPAGATGIAVWSLGPDGQDGTNDDVRSWHK